MSELSMDVFWSFRSPWSCLATPRLRDWQDRYVLNVRFRPVYPIAIRTPEFFLNAHPQWAPCFQQDLRRVAEYLGLPLVWPNPQPGRASTSRKWIVFSQTNRPEPSRGGGRFVLRACCQQTMESDPRCQVSR